MLWSDRLREILYPLLVVFIIGSLWVAARADAMVDDSRLSMSPAPAYEVLQAALHARESQASIAE